MLRDALSAPDGIGSTAWAPDVKAATPAMAEATEGHQPLPMPVTRPGECFTPSLRRGAEANHRAVCLLDAIEGADARTAARALTSADEARVLGPLMRACPRGQPLADVLGAALRERGAPLTALGSLLADDTAAALLTTFARSEDLGASSALLGCLAGRTASVIMAHDALALRASCPHPNLLRGMMARLPDHCLAAALGSGRGQVVAALLRQGDAEGLLGGWLQAIVDVGDRQAAALLLAASPDLLPLAVQGRRLVVPLAGLVELAGAPYDALVQDTRRCTELFCQAAAPGPAP